MKAAVFHGAGRPLTVETLPDPTPSPTDVIIAVHRCGICGTDVHSTSGHGWDFPSGSVIGHEYTGEVVAVGSAVKRLKIGHRVSGMAKAGCGACEACLRGFPIFCPRAQQDMMGGFGEYLRMPEDAAIVLPLTLSAADGALVEPLAVGLRGVRSADMPVGAKVLVIGAGSVGLATIFWARRLGAGSIVAASRSRRRESMALSMGANGFVQAGSDEVEQVIAALGAAPDIVFECTGAAGTLGQAICHVKLFGKIVSLGFCTSADPIIPGVAAYKQIQMSFPLTYTPGEFQHAADQMLAGSVDPKMMITSVISLDELPATLESLRGPHEQVKVHVSMTPISAGNPSP
jgi:threonine dehydrogenase-like Zn-dependent dehydrogenase